ncbi:CoA transferase [Phytohabitans sp. ZYX-F-186]|uniref:CoA transferase n=1 Tax=Phytohabitans maris TaxID=3071409 RepID=A0ABU0ZWG5_9ACTN|nr:CoA transferase [Phytohabitans sp. ZYX-F-186]MDQ7910847.1 CoA transferase [Phytohabitans sp. ZYX-F-186]
MTAPPLQGIRVLDFTRHLAGPYATTILGDFGADVIKVESRPDGDPTRHLRMGVEPPDADSQAFMNYNHGKRSIAIDLRRPDGVALARRLARGCDVVIENYRPGVADAIGIGYEALSADNPGLIYCALSAFGQNGPWARQPATDPVVQAMSGVLEVTGHAGDPVRVGVPISDVVGGMASVQGILLALYARRHTGVGQLVDVSLLHAMILTHTTRLAEYFATGAEPRGQGTAHSLVAPYELFETADGKVIAGSWAEDTWPRFCRAIGRTDLTEDPRFKTNVLRVRHRAELAAIIQAELSQRTTEQWQGSFHEANALFGPLLPISQAITHAQMEDRPAVVRIPHPVHGTVSVPNPASAVRLHGTPGGVRIAPALLSQHAREILLDFGLSTAEIDALGRDGTVDLGQDEVSHEAAQHV